MSYRLVLASAVIAFGLTTSCGLAADIEEMRKGWQEFVDTSNLVLECDGAMTNVQAYDDETHSSRLGLHKETKEHYRVILFATKDEDITAISDTTTPMRGCSKSESGDYTCEVKERLDQVEIKRKIRLNDVSGLVYYTVDWDYDSESPMTAYVDGKTPKLFRKTDQFLGYCRKREGKKAF